MMKTYIVKYPSHTISVEAESAEAAFYECAHASLKDCQKDEEYGHLYSAEEVKTPVRNFLRGTAGIVCIVSLIIAGVVSGLLFKIGG
jgi:hypothetical protein